MALTLHHQTPAEFASRFWRRVLSAQRAGDTLASHRLIWWLLERIVAGDIADAQARATFNAEFGQALSAAAWAALKTTKLQPMHDRYAALIAKADL